MNTSGPGTLSDEVLQFSMYNLTLVSPPHLFIPNTGLMIDPFAEPPSPPPESSSSESSHDAQPQDTPCEFRRRFHEFLTGKYSCAVLVRHLN